MVPERTIFTCAWIFGSSASVNAYMCALCFADLLVTVPQRRAESAIENAHRFAPLHADPSPVLFIERGPHDLHEIVGQLLPSVRSFRILSGEALGYHSSAICGEHWKICHYLVDTHRSVPLRDHSQARVSVFGVRLPLVSRFL